MKRIFKACLALACVAALTTGCSSSSSSAISKAGLGIVSSVDEEMDYTEGKNAYFVNTTFVTVGLDSDGKIVDINIDVAKSNPSSATPTLKSKKDLKEDYGMKSSSGIQKEWYEQIAAFEEYAKGKTADEISAIETDVNEEGNATAKAGTDLAAGCTISITDIQEAVKKACENAIDVEADSVTMGYVMEKEESEYSGSQLDTTVAMIAKSGDKIAAAKIDVAQISGEKDANVQSKSEKQDDYNMKSSSGIQKEWYEQAAAYEAFITGKTAEEVAAIETEENSEGNAVAKSGSDLAAGCTISISAFQQAVANAMQ
jgi:hypothetical protein